MNEPVISIITPACNPGSAILETWASLEKQVYRDFEWVIVDDYSRDEERKYFDEICAKATFKVVLVVNAVNLRQTKSKNIGLAIAKGQYIKFLDADDILDPNHLQEQLAYISTQALSPISGAVYSPTVNVYRNTNNTTTRESKNCSYQSVPGDLTSQLARFIVSPYFHHCSCLFFVETLRACDGFDESLITDEDGDLIIRLMLMGIQFHCVERASYFYIHRSHLSRVSANDNMLKWECRAAVCENIALAIASQSSAMVLQRSVAQRYDLLGVLCYGINPAFAHLMFMKAKELHPDYYYPVHPVFKMFRKIFGIKAYCFLRSMRMK